MEPHDTSQAPPEKATGPGNWRHAFLFGAGASVAAGVPLVKDFVLRARQVAASGPTPDPIASTLAAISNRYAHLEGNIEELFILADLRSRIDSPDHTESLFDSDAITELIRWTIRQTQPAEAAPHLANLAREIEDRWSPRFSDIAIISMNWDVVLEQAFAEVGVAMDMGVDFERPDSQMVTSRDKPFIRLFKVHGSIDWQVCTEHGLFLEDDSQEQESLEASPCPICQRSRYFGFIPPTSMKLGGDPKYDRFQALWGKAQAVLQECDWLTVVGYSFPPTDVQLRILIQDAVRVNPNLHRIQIVGGYRTARERVEFEDWCDRALGTVRPDIRIEYIHAKFEDSLERVV